MRFLACPKNVLYISNSKLGNGRCATEEKIGAEEIVDFDIGHYVTDDALIHQRACVHQLS